MMFDLDPFDLSGWDILIVSDSIELKLMKCAIWTEGDTHGGSISEYEVDFLFDDISEAQNVSGTTDYRKCFISAGADGISEKKFRVSLNVDNSVLSRMAVYIANGTDSDTFLTKPDAAAFSSFVELSIQPNTAKPVWIKRVITAAIEENPAYIRNATVIMTVSN